MTFTKQLIDFSSTFCGQHTHMTAGGYRKCDHALEYGDSVCHMTEVNKGARKIMSEVPDELTSMITWTVLGGAFILLLVAATCLVLSVESTAEELPVAVHLAGDTSTVTNKTAQKVLCPAASTDLQVTLEQLDGTCRTSELMTLHGLGVDDVHYVFANTETVPWESVCSVESALRAVGNSSRVNVFVVRGLDDHEHSSLTYTQRSVSLSTGLSELMTKYGAGRLNVIQIGLNGCLACSPFRDVLQNLKERPELARFAVQLTVLWQFGGTVLNPSVVAVRDCVYRANGTAVEYGDRTVSAPAACHSFVFDAMLYVKRYVVEPFGPGTVRSVWQSAIDQTGSASHREARPVPQWVVGHGAVEDSSCYYVETGHNSIYHGYCPTAVALG